MSLTENNALSYSNDNPLLEIFYRFVRPAEDSPFIHTKTILLALKKCKTLHVLKLLFHLRSVRGGKGERKLFYESMKVIMKTCPENIAINLEHIPFYGFWKDLLVICAGTQMESAMIDLYCAQLLKDKVASEQLSGNKDASTLSLAAKWAPSEGKHFDCEHNLAKKFRDKLGLTAKEYRVMLAGLHKKLAIVETPICDNHFEQIDYSKLPSLAYKKYMTMFQKKDNIRFMEHIKKCSEGKSKINTKTLSLYQIIEQLEKIHKPDQSLNVLWNQKIAQMRKDLIAANVSLQGIAIADLSGSMKGLPMQNAIAFSIAWADLAEGPHEKGLYVFSNRARFVQLDSSMTIWDKYSAVMGVAGICENTNIQAVFDDLLTRDIKPEYYPRRLWIFTDGQFDAMTDNSSKTCLIVIHNKHILAGYTVPEIIFWNLRGDTIDFPANANDRGVCCLSGFSDVLMRLVIEGRPLNPLSMLFAAIDDPIFDRIKAVDYVDLDGKL